MFVTLISSGFREIRIFFIKLASLAQLTRDVTFHNQFLIHDQIVQRIRPVLVDDQKN
jgi:hypothetical protein